MRNRQGNNGRISIRVLFLFGFFLTLPITLLAYTAEDYYKPAAQYYQLGQFDQSIQQCKYALMLNPDFWQAYQLMGYCYCREKNYSQALQALDQSLRINPNNPTLAQYDQKIRGVVPSTTPVPGTAPVAAAPIATATPIATEINPNARVVVSGTPTPIPAGININLRKQGELNLECGGTLWLASWDDLSNLYNVDLSNYDVPFGTNLNLGVAYALSQNFQLGVRFEYLYKMTEVLNFADVLDQSFVENAIGGAVRAEGILPVDDGVNLIGSVEGGYYALMGYARASGLYSATGNLGGSAPGVQASLGLEFMMDAQKTWALDFGVYYQYLSFASVTYTSSTNGTSSAPIPNQIADSPNTSLDFSGPGIFASARFF